MTSPIIEVEIADILKDIQSTQTKLLEEIYEVKVAQARMDGKIDALDEKLSGQIKSVDEKLSGQIKSVDEKLSGQIKSVDEKLSGQIKTLDAKVDQLDKRIANQEFNNRGILVGLILVMLGGLVKLFELWNF